MWRRTVSFDDESDACRGSWSDLADAASALLENSALNEAAKPPQQQQQQQQHRQTSDCPVVHSRQCNKCSAAAGGNWEAFVQECLGSTTPAVTSAELLGHGQQLCQQAGQQVGQQAGQQVGQQVSQQEGEQVGHCQQQNADVSSSVNRPFQCQVRLKNGPKHSCVQGLHRDKRLQTAWNCITTCKK